ncbi:MAG: MaoC/PaaZ C-terminal domain-containing protein, partial [Deltaproteobacteria bacterium]|nr:MaoC/PaaZ C-terminal domain-containing protein [Deltaproteobacteria bacterium]
NRDMLGFSEEAQLPPIYLEDVKLYAAATNDNPDLYSDTTTVPPLFLSRLIHPFLTDVITKPELRMNILKMVHGELFIRWISSISPSDRLTLRMHLREILDTPAGELLKISFIIKKGQTEAAEAIAGLLIRNPSGEKSKKEEERREPFYTIGIKTLQEQALKYAKASLDNNLIHTSTLFAKIAGLKRPILHGVCVFAITCNELLKRFADGNKNRLVSMSGRFAYPVYPGETITLRCFKSGSNNIVDFDVINQGGRQNIRFGRFEFRNQSDE